MKRLGYLLAYPFLWVMSKLPDPLFYGVSDGVFFLVYYVVRYRRKVVHANLRRAFPEKKPREIKQITKRFYHHFCDIFLEMTKSLSISEEDLKKRFVLKNPDEMKRLEALGKSYVMMIAHYNSYEWVTALQLQGMQFKAYGIYKRIRNPCFDKLIRESRGKFNTHMLDKNDVVREMIKNKTKGILSVYGMIADQSPKQSPYNYRLSFFGHEVPAFLGSEKMAKKLDLAVTYLKIEKVKRGYYEAEYVPMADNPKEVEDYKITDRYFELLEKQIRNHPEHYLWTHKRWKHEKKQD